MYKIIGTDNKVYGPVSIEQLRQWLAENRLRADTRVQADGTAEWRLLNELPEFAGSFQPAPPSVAAPLPPALSQTAPVKPGKLQAIAIMTMISGILHVIAGISWLFFGLSLFLVGVVFTIIPASYVTVLGVLEIINATKLLSTPIRLSTPPKYLAIMEIIGIIFCDVVGLVIGILNLVFYNDEEVQRCFASRA